MTTSAVDGFNYVGSEGWKLACAARILTTGIHVLLSVAGFLLAHSSEWKINQVLHPMWCYCFVASDGVGLVPGHLFLSVFNF